MQIKETNLKFKRDHDRRKTTELIVIHHGAGSKTETAERYHQMHINRGWYGLGYNYVIEWDGTIKRGRPEWAIGAHSKPVNSKSIGICLIGDFTKHKPSDAQLISLIWLINDIWSRYPKLKVVRHKDTDTTACPGNLFPWDKLLVELAKGVIDVALEKWMVEGGRSALAYLEKKGLVLNAADWGKEEKLAAATPQYLFWMLMERLAKRQEGE